MHGQLSCCGLCLSSNGIHRTVSISSHAYIYINIPRRSILRGGDFGDSLQMHMTCHVRKNVFTFICWICALSGKTLESRTINDVNSGRNTLTLPQRDPCDRDAVSKMALHSFASFWPTDSSLIGVRTSGIWGPRVDNVIIKTSTKQEDTKGRRLLPNKSYI